MPTVLSGSVIGAIIALAGVGPAAAAADVLAPCERLATAARAAPASAWREKLEALQPSLSLVQPTEKPDGFEAKVAALPLLSEPLGVEGGYAVEIARMPGTDIYLAFDIQGTLDCETIALANAPASGAARLVDAPPAYSDLCWTDSAHVGAVFGKPAFVETDSFTVADPATDEVEVAPWTGAGWAPACQLTLDYRTEARVTEQFCGDIDACRQIAPLAAAIAEAHRRPRKEDEPFVFGGVKPDEAAIAQLKADQSGGETTTAFPTFGAKAKTEFDSYSYNDFDLFSLAAGGKAYVAAIGYGGVGWRTLGDALLAVYEVKAGKAVPAAGFVIARSVVGLSRASVSIPKPYQAP